MRSLIYSISSSMYVRQLESETRRREQSLVSYAAFQKQWYLRSACNAEDKVTVQGLLVVNISAWFGLLE